MSTKNISWSFTYTGPRELVDDPDCHECLAIATKKSRKGPQAYTVPGATPEQLEAVKLNCPAHTIERRIAAGKRVWCPNHCGLKTALETHPILHVEGTASDGNRIPPDHKPSFDAFAAAVLAFVSTIPSEHKSVDVQGSAFEDPLAEQGYVEMVMVDGKPTRFDREEHKDLVPVLEATSAPFPTYAEFRFSVRVPRAR